LRERRDTLTAKSAPTVRHDLAEDVLPSEPSLRSRGATAHVLCNHLDPTESHVSRELCLRELNIGAAGIVAALCEAALPRIADGDLRAPFGVTRGWTIFGSVIAVVQPVRS
jgi:hypothetical protein